MGKGLHIISGQALWGWRREAIAQAKTADIEPAEVDWLLQGLCEIESLALRLGTLAQQPKVSAQVSLAELQAMWERRVGDRVPIQQLVGRTPWRNFSLRVSPNVLIPRPETELIIDIAQSLVDQSPDSEQLKQGTWVDMGTGSGAIALGLAEVFPDAEIIAVDVSEAALEIARLNAEENGLSDRIQFLQGSWYEPLAPWQGKLVGLVSNPPYIPQAIVPTLEPEVAKHEPYLALDGGDDGLDAVRHLINHADLFLVPGGIWLIELMIGQSSSVANLLTQTGYFENIRSFKDLAAVERFISATKFRKTAQVGRCN